MRRIGALLLVLSLLAAAAAVLTGQRAGERPREDAARSQNRFGLPTPKPRTPGAIRIATYNVLNLFDHTDDPALEGEHDDIRMATSDDRCRGIAKAIRAVDADVLALQEIESLECLRWFRDTYLDGLGYEHIVSHDVGYYRGIEQAVMSRFPITASKVWPDASLDTVRRVGSGFDDVPPQGRRGLTFQRSPLCVRVRVDDDYELTIFSIHHKSGRDYRWQREAEALRTVEFLERMRAEDPSRNLVVMGDFNAAPWDKSFRLYLEAGMIDTLDHRIIPRWRDADETEPNLYKTHESGRVLDYILLNSATHRELVIGSAHVYGTLYDESYNWRTDPYPDGYASDHYPVILDLIPGDVK